MEQACLCTPGVVFPTLDLKRSWGLEWAQGSLSGAGPSSGTAFLPEQVGQEVLQGAAGKGPRPGLEVADAEGDRWEGLAVGGLEESLQGSGHEETGLCTLLAPASPKYLLTKLCHKNPRFILCSRWTGPWEPWCLTSTCPVHRRGEARGP